MDAQTIRLRPKPRICVSDNGTQLSSTANLFRQQVNGVAVHYIQPVASQSRTRSLRASTGDCATSA